MFIRSMDSDYQVLSALQKNEYYAGYRCRRMGSEERTEAECFLHVFEPEKTDQAARRCLMDFAAKKEAADLTAVFLSGDFLCLEFPVKEGCNIRDALTSRAEGRKELSLKDKLQGILQADGSLAENIAMSKRLMENCLSLRLPSGMLYEVLDLRNLLYTDGQFDFLYEFREPEKLFADRNGDVCRSLAKLQRLIFGNYLKCKAAEPLSAWICRLEDPAADIQKLTDIYPSYYEAMEVLENSPEEDRVMVSESRKKLERLLAHVKHILSPVPLGESDYVIIGNYHVFTKFLILGGAAAVAAAAELGKVMHIW